MKWDWKVIVICAGVVLLCLGGYELLQEHDARVKAESTQAAQQQVIASAQKQIDQAKADAAQAQQDLGQRIADLEKQKQQPVTAPQFVLDASKLFPSLPQPMTVVQPAPQQQTVNGKTETVPSAPAVQIPQADLQALRDYKINCDETSAKLQACQLADAADATQISALNTQLKSTVAEREQWKAAAKGGSWLHRLKGDMKCLAISAAAAGAGAYAYKKSPAIGAIAGVAGGEIACRIF